MRNQDNLFDKMAAKKRSEEASTCHMFQMLEESTKAIHVRLLEQNKKIDNLQDQNRIMNQTNKTLVEENRKLKCQLAVSEDKVKNLQSSHKKIRAVVARLQSYVSKQDKLSAIKHVLLRGMFEGNAMAQQDLVIRQK